MFRVVFVCTGNRCRSPLAEVALRAAIPNSWIDISSAGTLDLGPATVPKEMVRAGQKLGLDLAKHRALPITEASLESADLVLGMTLEHVADATVNGGAHPERTFTLTEFADVLERVVAPSETDPEQYARALVARAHELRRGSNVIPSDIVDPIGGPRRLYRDVAQQIQQLCKEVAGALRPSPNG